MVYRRRPGLGHALGAAVLILFSVVEGWNIVLVAVVVHDLVEALAYLAPEEGLAVF